ncbi:Hypothetical protein R9X50_00410300 [Acrodontium crateriforme]|uniref:Uncharacterized protein n=1 Tax=Acrodontium crateriforme TaxID=150365 RepID=A0AAQ3M5J2_9PEZI|nr:Hypothetical protein R9X50_00410300 [Acrodontium crateriforme]
MVQRPRRPAMYNTPAIRNGGFGALQVEAITNRPLSIARRHLAASQLRMRNIEPHELSSSEWVRFLVMEEPERERWIMTFQRCRRRNSDESETSIELERDARPRKSSDADGTATSSSGTNIRPSRRNTVGGSNSMASWPAPSTPAVTAWVRHLSGDPDGDNWMPRRPRRNLTESAIEAPPTYETALRSSTPPPAYEPRSP